MPAPERRTTRQSATSRLRADVLTLLWLLLGGLRLAWFLTLNLRLVLSTLPRVEQARRSAPPAASSLPLRKLADGVYKFAGPHAEPNARAPLVLHFTGTGESVHTAFEVVHPLCAREHALREAVHYVFQAPAARGAYYGPHVFASAMWERVAPVVEHYDGPFVLIGLSRGGLVALELGMRIVTELGKVASVLCMSAPLDVPTHIPRAVHTIASFETMLQRLSELLPEASHRVRSFAESSVRRFHLLLTALILADFEIDDPRQLQLQLAELAEHGVLASSQRAAREFRLLLQATRRDGQLFCQQLASATAHNAGRLYAALLWGERDSWIEPRVCEAQLREAMRREPVHDWLHMELVPDQGHALARTSKDNAQVTRWLQRVAERAEQGALASRTRADRSQRLETLLLDRAAEGES